MALYSIKGDRLTLVGEKAIALEKHLQKLTEDNLQEVFGLVKVKSEFSLKGFRIDTLAYDPENKSFVIIEYKRDKSFSVIDQGYSYLSLMLNNKAEFTEEYREQLGKDLKRDEVDWSQSKVLFLARAFSTYQENAIHFKDLPIELWKVKVFENNTILYNKLDSSDTKASVKTLEKNPEVRQVTKEVIVPSVADHLEGLKEETRDLFFELRERVMNFGSEIQEVPKKKYLAYKVNNKNFVDVIFYKQRNELRLTLNLKSGELSDPKNLATDFTKPPKGHWGNGDYEVIIHDQKDINYALLLVQQAYEKALRNLKT